MIPPDHMQPPRREARSDTRREARSIRGRLTAELRQPGGPVLARRRVHNTVLRSGAELLADLIRGVAVTPINGFAVGLSSEPSAPPYEATALTTGTPGGTPLLLDSVAALSAEQLEVETVTEDLLVRVRVRGLLAPQQAVSPEPTEKSVLLGEAALGVLAEDGQSLTRIYNRVVFEPIPKSREHELALYWEIDFPYGP